MIVDARSLAENETIESDVCIVGAGIAGITLAREFIGEEFRVCLLESGGFEPDKATQSLYWGKNTGHPYYELDTARMRCFGGTSHLWLIEIGKNRLGARMHPLDEIDFEKRDWVSYSGWPFDKAHLDPYYERAQAICQLGPYSYDVEDWEEPEKAPRLPFANGRVETTIFQFGPRDPFFRDYRYEIEQAENITTFLHANVLEIDLTETGQSVTRLKVGCLEGNQFWVSAKLFIVAVGGIETPRLLLLSNKVQPSGVGNQYDLVGRFFMEHPHLWSGLYVPSNASIFDKIDLYQIHSVRNGTIMAKFILAEEVLRREKILNYCVSIHPRTWPSRFLKVTSPGIDSLKALGSSMRRGKIPTGFGKHLSNVMGNLDDIAVATYRKMARELGETFEKFTGPQQAEVFYLNHMTEQVPNPNSRVTLGAERDAFGQNRVELDWQLTPLDIRSIIRAQEIVDEELQRAGLGRLIIEMADDTPPVKLQGGWHHMGTTRMHPSPKEGVVDENCRVHGISNLFIGGPSIFPTSGYANPVLTTVALAVRLAEYIKKLVA